MNKRTCNLKTVKFSNDMKTVDKKKLQSLGKKAGLREKGEE